jgi:dTDP-4-amino-4,6-dideoxygalactose transaminase
MKIQRTLPPTAAPVSLRSLFHGLTALLSGRDETGNRLEELKVYFNVRHAFLVSSGKAALYLILTALKSLSPEKRQVVIPAYTCFSVPSAVVKAGLEVVLCDIDPETFDFDYGDLESVLNEKTLCVGPNHLFGIPADMDRIREICRQNKIVVLEDAAQAMGGTYKGRKLGTLGEVGFFSLGRGKNITCGSGGIIVTDSDAIAEAISREYRRLHVSNFANDAKEFTKLALMTVFVHPSLYWLPAGIPFLELGQTFFYEDFPVRRLSRMNVAVLEGWENHLERVNRERSRRTASWITCLGLPGRGMESIPCLRLPVLAGSASLRERLLALSAKHGFGLSPLYPHPINEINQMKGHLNGKAVPKAREVSERLLTLPTHAFVSEKDQDEIMKCWTLHHG